MYKAVIFDLDGTLLDTLPDIERAMHKVLAGHSLPDPYTTGDFKKMVGWGIKTLMRKAVPAAWQTEERLDRLTRELIAEYAKEPCVSTVPYPEVPELLSALEQKGIPKAILSNKPHELMGTIVRQCLGNWTFAFFQGAGHAFPLKPAPDAALHLAKDMRLPPAELIFLGDSEMDMETAVRAGMFPAGALWGYQTKNELLRGGACELLQTPLGLLKFF